MMKELLQKKLSDSAAARWAALLAVSFTMMCGYFFTDVMSPLEPMLTSNDVNGLGWTSDEYGFFSGAYGYFNVFLLLLFFGGIILDKFGIRFTGLASTLLMFGGALIKWWAVSNTFDGSVTLPFGIGTYHTQVLWASLGFAIYGAGCEIAGITVTKIIAKWFTGHELALAMGFQVAFGAYRHSLRPRPRPSVCQSVRRSTCSGRSWRRIALHQCRSLLGLLRNGQERRRLGRSRTDRTGRRIQILRPQDADQQPRLGIWQHSALCSTQECFLSLNSPQNLWYSNMA